VLRRGKSVPEPVNDEVGSVGHSVNTSLGNGDGRVSLTTNVGSIRIR
jgi:hypothetical protein